jgi:starch phosphorylase
MVVDGASAERGRLRFEGSFTCERPGRYGYTVRVVPAHPDLRDFSEVGLMTWA